jgi:hypothetical protein
VLPPRRSLVLLGRPGCHLCEEFEEELRAHPAYAGVTLEQADVDSRDDWRASYGRRIPVLLDEQGHVLCEGHFDPQSLASG